jgi:hypothetical protein
MGHAESHSQDVAERVLGTGEDYFSGPLSEQMVQDIKTLWKEDNGIKEAYQNSNQYQLIDSAS